MDKESEWKMLFEANAKLNSPEAQAAIKQLVTLQHLSDEEMRATAPAAEPIELPYVPSVAKTVVEMKNQLRVLQDSLDAERQARIDSEKLPCASGVLSAFVSGVLLLPRLLAVSQLSPV